MSYGPNWGQGILPHYTEETLRAKSIFDPHSGFEDDLPKSEFEVFPVSIALTSVSITNDYCALHDALAGALALLHSLTDDAFEDHPDAWTLIDQYSAVLAESDGSMCAE